MASSHNGSWFTYSITRRYPFRWFTPVALAVFALLTALFSFVSYVYNGYILINVVSSNPNATMTSHWFPKWPLTSQAQSTCQTVSLQVNSDIFTNQTALIYTLTNISAVATANEDQASTFAPSLTYLNNVIEDCTIWAIQINLEAMDRSANQFAYDEWGAQVWTYINCAVQTANSTLRFNLTQQYDYVPPSVTMASLYMYLGSAFISRNPNSKASLWWGESLLSTYWALLTMQMQQIRQVINEGDQPAIRKGTLMFYPNPPLRKDITDLEFFQVDYRYIIDSMDPPGTFSVVHPGLYGDSHNLSYLTGKYPDVWVSADKLAKSVYSTVLADLGQVDAAPNILANASALEYYTRPFDNLQISINIANAVPGPATAPYVSQGSSTGPLGITPSIINAEYLCQIPRRKSTGNLILSILVADLVFLQISWQVFKLVIEGIFLRGDDAQKCYGCASAKKQPNLIPEYELVPSNANDNFTGSHRRDQSFYMPTSMSR